MPASPSAIRFVLDGEIRTLTGIDPTRTVLTWLREDLGRTGTKEGCAEGDCGACTVVLGELHAGRVRFRAINSCIQFLPTLDGKALFTVESLKAPDGALHPVQQAMVDCHGSQCGFCTPGFVMSLFAQYRASPIAPTRKEAEDVLAGNLCRCTGYRPILDAAQRMVEYGAGLGEGRPWHHRLPADEPNAEERAVAAQLESTRRDAGLEYEAAGKRYWAPVSLTELAAIRAEHPDARIVAGCTDVGLWVTKQHRDLAQIVYVGNVAELEAIRRTPTHLEIGAGAKLTDVLPHLAALHPDLGELLRRFASPPIRNAGTLGGNVANGSPIGDSMPALIALGTTVVLRKAGATRELPLEAFYLAYQKTALEPGEFVERLVIPAPKASARFRTYKVSKRVDQDISAVCAAFLVDLDGSRVREARVAFGGMAAIPKRAANCEAALVGREWTMNTLVTAQAALDRDFTPIADMRASTGYRRLVARNLLLKCFIETSGATAPTRVQAVEARS